MKKARLIIVGLDGVPFDLLRTLSRNGTMPNTDKLINGSIFKKMQSSIPEISSVAWSSIITGSNPGEHGIFGFMDFAPGTYRLFFPNYNNLQRPAFWADSKEKSIIINVPSTYPVKEMNGAHISGFVSIDFNKSVYPGSLIPKLREMDYRLDVDSDKAHKSFDLFFADLEKTLVARIKAYQYLWRYTDWDTFMLVFTGTDRLMHFLWEAYEDNNHKYHGKFLEHFNKVDAAIGQMLDNLNENDIFIMLSDHGFGRLDKDIYSNHFLYKENFLDFHNSPKPAWNNIGPLTKAFALDPSRIYVNLKNKYPNGSVDVNDKESILKDVENLFNSVEIGGKKVIKNIYRKEQIYSGPLLDNAPDLVLVGNDGFNLKASLNLENPAGKGIFTGKHTLDDAFLLVKGKDGSDYMPEYPNVSNVIGIIEKLRRVV